jgi:putative DNA primase/helicase
MIIPTTEQMTIFGANNGVWEYRSLDNEFICFVVRYDNNGKKSFKPFTLQDNKLIPKWFKDENGETVKTRPLYGLPLLKLYPNKNILIVEGEKTADAAQLLFPEYMVLAWMGGSGMAKHVDLSLLSGHKICLWPDNDENGINAMEIIRSRCIDIVDSISIINVSSLGLEPKWDLADFDSENSEIDFEYIKLLIQESFNQKKIFDLLSYPHLSEGKNPRPLDTTDN